MPEPRCCTLGEAAVPITPTMWGRQEQGSSPLGESPNETWVGQASLEVALIWVTYPSTLPSLTQDPCPT